MSDIGAPFYRPMTITLAGHAIQQPVGEAMQISRAPVLNTAGAWPAANRAIFLPLVVEIPTTVTKLGIYNGAVAGEVDVGIYSYVGTGTSATRVISAGKTAMAGASVLQIFDVEDKLLVPGNYFIAAVCSTITTATFQRSTINSSLLKTAGVAQQGLAETKLPETATLERAASSYVPAIFALLDRTTL